MFSKASRPIIIAHQTLYFEWRITLFIATYIFTFNQVIRSRYAVRYCIMHVYLKQGYNSYLCNSIRSKLE